jgi:beta-phosphoglucomutase-like phosphatase (HAD superfamily)
MCEAGGVTRQSGRVPERHALIFDFDGLMIDSERLLAELAIEAAATLGATLTLDDIGHLFGSTESDHLWEELLSNRLGRPVALTELEVLVTPGLRDRVKALPLLPGVRVLLDGAKTHGAAAASRPDTIACASPSNCADWAWRTTSPRS